MVHKNLQVLGFLSLLISFGFLLSTMIYDTGKQWRVMAMGGEAVEAVVKYDGLFLRCTMYPTGQEECEGLDGGNLPEYTIACRAMMFIALALCIGSIMMYFVGSAHTVCMYRDRKATSKKAKVIVYSGALAIIYSLFCLIAAIMYSLGVNSSSNTDFIMNNGQVLGGNTGSYETGQCVTYCYIGMAFGIVYGISAIVSSKGSAFKKGEDLKNNNVWDYVGGDEYAAPNRYDGGNFDAYSSNQKPAYGGENIPMSGRNSRGGDQDYI